VVVRGRERSEDARGSSATIGGGRPGWIFDATCGGNVNIALPGLQRVGGFTKWASVDTSRSFHPPLFPSRAHPSCPVPPKPPFSSLRPAPSVLPLPAAQTTPSCRPHPPLAKADSDGVPLHLWESRPSNLFSLRRPRVYVARSSCRQYRFSLITFMSYFFSFFFLQERCDNLIKDRTPKVNCFAFAGSRSKRNT